VREVLSFADLSRLTVSEKPTYSWHARRESLAEDAVTVRGFGAVYEGFRPQVSATETWHDAVFLASLDPMVQLEVARNARAGVLFGADTMDTFIRDRRKNFEEVMELVRLLIINTTELEMLSRTRGIASAAEYVLSRHRGMTAVIVKRGAGGAVLITRGGSRRLHAYQTKVVDPTGAGDVLAGALMGRLVRGGRRLDQDSLVDALQWGLVAASFAVEKPGIAGIRDCTPAEIQARFDAYRLEAHPGKARES